MASAPKKICNYPGCGVLTNARYCSKHDKPSIRRQKDTRGNSASRGYGGDWRRLRSSYIMHNPLCAECERQGKTTAATEVDHIQKFRGVHDPLRLDWSNLQSLCGKCHRQKTARELDRRQT